MYASRRENTNLLLVSLQQTSYQKFSSRDTGRVSDVPYRSLKTSLGKLMTSAWCHWVKWKLQVVLTRERLLRSTWDLHHWNQCILATGCQVFILGWTTPLNAPPPHAHLALPRWRLRSVGGRDSLGHGFPPTFSCTKERQSSSRKYKHALGATFILHAESLRIILRQHTKLALIVPAPCKTRWSVKNDEIEVQLRLRVLSGDL